MEKSNLQFDDVNDKLLQINKLTHFNNISLQLFVEKPIISIIVDDVTYNIIIDKIPIKMLVEIGAMERYSFLIENLKNMSFTNNIHPIDQCAMALSFLLALLSSQYDTLYIFDEDVDSIIGDHVIKNDVIKLEYMKKKIEIADLQYIEKEQRYKTKLKLNILYNELLEKISLYQDQMHTMYDDVIKNDKCINNEIKSLVHILKNNKKSLKTMKLFCETLYKLLELYPLNVNNIVYPINFLKYIEPQVINLIEKTKMLNVHNIHQKLTISVEKISEYIRQLQSQNKPYDNCDLSQIIKRTISLTLGLSSIKELECAENNSVAKIIQLNENVFSSVLQDKLITCPDFFTKIIQGLIKKYSFIQSNTMHQIVKQIIHSQNKENVINIMIFKTTELPNYEKTQCWMKQICESMPDGMIELTHIGRKYKYQWDTTSTKLCTLISEYVRKRITCDNILSIQIILLYETIQYITNVLNITHINTNNIDNQSIQSVPVEYHIKGGFCRDLILSYLSEAVFVQTEHTENNQSKKRFQKSIKDIDVAMNIDPEIFTYYFCQIASTKYNIHPSKRWNNNEKSEKGKNISVWSVKLIPDFEAIEFVHFRTDIYDQETCIVEAIDAYESIIDDTRRDIPWPSFRLNDFVIIDYFNIIGMLNRGDFVIRTPPYQSELYKTQEQEQEQEQEPIPIDIVNAKINYHTHIESAERILRMFKYVSPPFDSTFAFDYNIETKKFNQICNGFKIHNSLIKLYKNPETQEEIKIRNQIYQHIKKWLDTNILANVFKSIQLIICNQPDTFFHHMNSFGLIEIIFENNYCMEKTYVYTKTLKNMFKYSGIKFSLPYQILGIGAKNKKKLLSHMKKLSLSNETQKMAEILMDYSDDLFKDKHVDTMDQYNAIRYDPKIIKCFHQILITNGSCNIYLIELMSIMGVSIDRIDNSTIIATIKQKSDNAKIIKCLQFIMIEYTSVFFLSYCNNKNSKDWIISINNNFIKHILNMISWVLCTPLINTQQCENNKQIKYVTNILGSIIKKNLTYNDNLIKNTIDFLVWFENMAGATMNTIENHIIFVSTIIDHVIIVYDKLNTLNIDIIEKIKLILNDKIPSNKQKNAEINNLIEIQMPDLNEILFKQNISDSVFMNNEIKILKLLDSLV